MPRKQQKEPSKRFAKPQNKCFRLFFVMALLTCVHTPKSSAQEQNYSSMIAGPLGLNTVPNARLDKVGTVRLGTSTLDPYVHGYIGFQLAEPLYINIRQTAEVSNINDDADRLYPGVDFKLRILEEGPYRPAVVLGAQSAIGHKRMAGEYLALSKRYKNFDLTGGIGWGRFGSANHFKNPLKSVSKHFDNNRMLDGEQPNDISDWFTGENVGLFGGIEYFTPLKGLSLKFDIGGDRFEAEKAAFNFTPAAPWSIGATYQPSEWLNFSVGAQGTEKLMARMSLQNILQKWPDADFKEPRDKTTAFRPYRTGLTLPSEIRKAAQNENITLSKIIMNTHEAKVHLLLNEYNSTAKQIGDAVKHIANHAGPAIENIAITPNVMGLSGPEIKMLRADFEKAVTQNHGSPEEIWRNIEFNTNTTSKFKLSEMAKRGFLGFHNNMLILENHASLAEEDHGVLYRSSLIAKTHGPRLFGFLEHGYALRANLHDNIDRINDIRPQSLLPVRSDVDKFADRAFALEHLYLGWTASFKKDLHLSLIGGYLEEMYAGLGGEVLYRPFGSRISLGAEAWQSFKRNPSTDFNLRLNGDHVLTAHANAWYDLPHHDITINAKIGRFLAEDIGGRFALTKHFENGAALEGFITISDRQDFDLFGGTTQSYNGVRLSLPLGGIKYIPGNIKLNTRFEPFGRDTGQDIQKPVSLYDLTQPISFPHIKRNWNKIVPK